MIPVAISAALYLPAGVGWFVWFWISTRRLATRIDAADDPFAARSMRRRWLAFAILWATLANAWGFAAGAFMIVRNPAGVLPRITVIAIFAVLFVASILVVAGALWGIARVLFPITMPPKPVVAEAEEAVEPEAEPEEATALEAEPEAEADAVEPERRRHRRGKRRKDAPALEEAPPVEPEPVPEPEEPERGRHRRGNRGKAVPASTPAAAPEAEAVQDEPAPAEDTSYFDDEE